MPKLGEVFEIWKRHGGSSHGPRVETWTIPESNVNAFVEDLLKTYGVFDDTSQ